MPANEGLAYISLSRCASKQARSSAIPSTNSLLIAWLHCPIMRESCDKNVIMPLRGEMAGWEKAKRKQAEPEFFPLSDAGLVKGEILGLLSCTCMRVGKSRPPSFTEISSQIATGCRYFWQEVRALQPLHKWNLFANWCTKSTNRVPYHDDEKVSIQPRE